MFTQAEIEYIQKQFARGLNADAISNKLIDAGWDAEDIDDGIKEVMRLSPQGATITPDGSAAPVVEAKSPILKISIIIFILVILGGGAFAYYKFIYTKAQPVQINENVVATSTPENTILDTQSTTTLTNLDLSTSTLDQNIEAAETTPEPGENSLMISTTSITTTGTTPEPTTTVIESPTPTMVSTTTIATSTSTSKATTTKKTP